MPPPFDDLWFQLLVGMIVGLSLGSFATMLSYRLPRHLSIVKPDSFCPSCRTPLKTLDLIPVGSWLISGGKCRHCHAPIGGRYILIELVTGIASMAAFACIGFQSWLIAALIGITAVVTRVTMAIEQKPNRD